MPNERSLANLRPYAPGQSGNPGGRRKRVLSDRYEELMESVLPEELRKPLKLPAGALWGDAIALAAARTALKGSEVGVLQRKEIADRVEGKSAQRFELHPHGDQAVEFVVIYGAPLPSKRVEDEKKTIDIASVKQLPASEGSTDPSES
jgi:hypothetical protein